MKLALREDMTPGETLAERLEWLAEVGFEGVELCGGSLAMPHDEVRAAFAASPVRAVNLTGSFDLVDADLAKRAAGVAVTEARLRLAADLGAAGVLVVPQFGRRASLPDLSPYKTGAELERELFVHGLRALAPAAVAARVPLFLEPLNRYEAYLVNRLEQGVALAEEVGDGVAIMADFFHMNIEEADIAASIRAAGRHVVFVHVADSNRLQPGRGHLDFGPGFAALKAIGYDGWLGIECRVDGEKTAALRESMGLLRAWWDAA